MFHVNAITFSLCVYIYFVREEKLFVCDLAVAMDENVNTYHRYN